MEGLAFPAPYSPPAIVPSARLPASPGRREGGGPRSPAAAEPFSGSATPLPVRRPRGTALARPDLSPSAVGLCRSSGCMAVFKPRCR